MKKVRPKKLKKSQVHPVVLAIIYAERLAAKSGLWRTYHAVNDAKQVVGFELADRRIR